MNYNNNSHLLASIAIILICIGMFILLMLGTNSCSASKWNDGICPDCETKYELRAANDGYACPDCGNEVKRY
jgi:PHP family Zn ribbon phosphoesterase